MKPNHETRYLRASEIRVAMPTATEGDEPGPMTVSGYAAVFNSPSEDLGGFVETIAPGFFSKCLPTADVRALVNHEPWPILGRTKAGTLRLAEDSRGLRFELDLPSTDSAEELAAALQRGDLDAMSFGFVCGVDQWDTTDPNQCKRTLLECRELFDVSFATYPAYPETSCAVRSLASWRRDHPSPEILALRRKLADLGSRLTA